jgi:hypothetical protein
MNNSSTPLDTTNMSYIKAGKLPAESSLEAKQALPQPSQLSNK